jgi:hypothetical protein
MLQAGVGRLNDAVPHCLEIGRWSFTVQEWHFLTCRAPVPKKRTFHLLFKADIPFPYYMVPACKLTFSVSGRMVLRGVIPNLEMGLIFIRL